jgi:adhesin/invasin
VVVRDNRGNSVSGVTVQFITTAGGGSVAGGNAVTGSNGIASVDSWTLGATAGTQTLIARLQGLPDVIFTATAMPGQPAVVEAVTVSALGNVLANGLVATPPSVRVRDAGGNPLAGVTVTFTPDPAGTSGTVTGGTQITNASGIATVTSWSVGTVASSTAGLRVFVAGLDQEGSELVFTATVTSGAAALLTAAPGAALSQVSQVNTGGAVQVAPSVRITDAFGNGVSGATVVFTPAVGSGTVNSGASATLLTNANGIATLTDWTIPAGAGAIYTLTATATGLTNLVFTAATAP